MCSHVRLPSFGWIFVAVQQKHPCLSQSLCLCFPLLLQWDIQAKPGPDAVAERKGHLSEVIRRKQEKANWRYSPPGVTPMCAWAMASVHFPQLCSKILEAWQWPRADHEVRFLYCTRALATKYFFWHVAFLAPFCLISPQIMHIYAFINKCSSWVSPVAKHFPGLKI